MRSSKFLIGTFIVGFFLFAAAISQAQQANRVKRSQEEIGTEIQRNAQIQWAESTLSRNVQRALRSSRPEPAAGMHEAVSVLRSNAGPQHEENLRSALTMIESETGKPLTRILPPQEAAGPAATYEGDLGMGGFWEYGIFTLIAFAFAWIVFAWSWTDLDAYRYRIEWRPEEYRKAA